MCLGLVHSKKRNHIWVKKGVQSVNILCVAPASFKRLALCSQPILTLSQEVTEFLAMSFVITHNVSEELPLLGSVALTWYRQAGS